jgi:hypothetical protein
MQTTPSVADRPPASRSALANRPLRLRNVDGRSAGARRFRDVAQALADDAGGPDRLSEPQRLIVRQAAVLSIQIERLQSQIVAGADVDAEQLVRLSNVQARLLASLGTQKGRPAEGASALHAYLAEIADRDAEAETAAHGEAEPEEAVP